MPLHDFPLILVTRNLGDFHVGGALFFEEVLAIHAKPERLAAIVRGLAKQILSKTAPLEVHRRVAGATPELTHLILPLDPPKKSLAWTQPITLRLDVLRWRHGEEAWIAHLPALGIEVVAAREEQLDELIPQHARVALARAGIVDRLFDLAQLARGDSIAIERETISVDIATPAQIAADRDKQADAKPVIGEAGIVLDDAHTAPTYEIDALVDRLADTLVGPRPRSVLLVGPSGVGKTAAFIELFRQRRRHRLGAAPFWMSSGARLVAGMSGFGLWQQRCQTLCREAKRDGAILHLGNLVELMEVGKAGGSQFGIASFFRPYLARGDVLAVAECTPEQLPLIERANPHLLAVFQTITVEEPPPHIGKMILLSAALAHGNSEGETVAKRTRTAAAPITEEALDLLDRLHRRYATYSASPGRPLRFLTNLLRDRPVTYERASGERVIPAPVSAADVTAAFSRETGLPSFLLDDAAPLNLPEARLHFSSRVIGQDEAVDRVTDLLATIKAAMNRPKRPIASLLFIGPTGVGKTEMAKALAGYFFGDRIDAGVANTAGGGRLVRFDMSEFATPAAVARLVGTAWESEGLLTSKIREQPFCVLLLDEFEKAHPAFFDLLLQVLGEGRLTDSAGRLADFSNAIVVMTSNLGAESFGAGPFGLSRATTPAAAHAREHFTDAVRAFVRPELFNRIDRVIPFLPLGPGAIEQIAAREIELISRRDGVRQRDLRLDASPAAIAHLARAGYDPVYGARPLKRRIERDLLAPLADSINQYAPTTPLLARVDVIDERLALTVRARRDEPTTTSPPLHPSAIATLRRRVQAIARCPAALSLQNELFTLDRQVVRKAAHPGRRMIEPEQRDRQKRLRIVADTIATLTAQVVTLEDALLLHFYEAAPLPFDPAELVHAMRRLEAGASQVLLELFSLNQDDPHTLTLALYGNAPAELFALASAYRTVATVPDSPPVRVSYFTRLGKTTLQRATVASEETDAFLSQPRSGILGIVLAIHAPFARPRFETESGLHVIEDDKNHAHPLLVDASPDSSAQYRPPKDVEFRIALAGQRRRTYILNRGEADDPITAKSYRWTGRAMSDALAAAIEDHLDRRTRAILEA
jgi:ATP-dependent Clp protease ATP-binding subunit ClpC